MVRAGTKIFVLPMILDLSLVVANMIATGGLRGH